MYTVWINCSDNNNNNNNNAVGIDGDKKMRDCRGDNNNNEVVALVTSEINEGICYMMIVITAILFQ